ncbi:MAG TPA: DUF5663 domain-containing protein [Candidatus Limnocylindria bacterium]
MIRIDEEMLAEVGLGDLPTPHRNELLTALYSELELRVGFELANAMTDAQLSEFEAFIDTEDEAGALAWLQTHFPDYRETVRRQYDLLRLELRASVVDIRAVHRALYGESDHEASTEPSPELPGWAD